MADLPIIDESKLDALGVRIFGLWPIHVSDRKAAEEQWMKSLRQFKGIYDPEVLAMIPAGASRAYPRLTRWKIIGTVARLLQMLFPSGEKNYTVKTSPLPDLSTTQLQEVLDALVAEKGEGTELTSDEIEKAIRAYAAGKAEKMEQKLDDDLQAMDYVTLARRVVFSAVLYSIGILKGPLHRKVKSRTWQRDQFTGKYTAIEVESFKPLFEFLPIWNWYPDMTATTLAARDGDFERNIMTRAQVEDLADRPDFLGDRIIKYLNEHTSGNYKAQWWESALKGEPKSDQTTVAQKESRKFELLSYWGDVSGHELAAAGVPIKEAELGKSFFANVWVIDNLVIKAKLAPLGESIKQHHIFMFEEDDLNLLGSSQAETLRDSQVSLCEITRAAHDNMSVIGPMVEINTELLTPGQSLALQKHKTWLRESTGAEAGYPAVRNITIESHLPELSQMRSEALDFADKESGLPPPSMGDTSGGGSEALRTSKNASMFLGAAALPIRDTVRNFDTFTVSAMTALVKWNMKYAPDPSRDGDHDVLARGSTSLIAKEVLAGSLNEFRASVTPDEAPHLKSRAMLISRMKVNDLPVEDFLEDEEKANQTIAAQQQAQQSQLANQEALIKAQVEKTFAEALNAAAKARAEDASIGTNVLALAIDALSKGHKADADTAKNLVAAHQADTARQAAEKPVTAGAA